MAMATVAQLAAFVDGDVVGDEDLEVSDAMPLNACRGGEVTLCTNDKNLDRLRVSSAVAVVTAELIEDCPLTQILVRDPVQSFAVIVQYFRSVVSHPCVGIHPTAIIDPSARIGDGVSIGAHSVVSAGVTIEDRVVIGAGVTVREHSVVGDSTQVYDRVAIYDRTIIGAHCVIHSGVTLGAFGFGYRQEEGRHTRTEQLGYVEVGDHCEIGANTAIDRGTFGPTRIGEGTKIDNLVQIGHNCQIGKHNLICAQVGVAGSCETGDYVVLAGQVGMRDHIRLGDRVVAGAQSGLAGDLEAGETVMGSPALPLKQQMQIYGVVSRLPEMRRTLKRLERQVSELSAQLTSSVGNSDNAPPSAEQNMSTGTVRRVA